MKRHGSDIRKQLRSCRAAALTEDERREELAVARRRIALKLDGRAQEQAAASRPRSKAS